VTASTIVRQSRATMKHKINSITMPELMNDAQAAEYLDTNKRTLRLWRHTRGLPFIRITSKVIRYRKSDIDAWVAQHRVALAA
jgi:excisionase family DNA binding protein